MLSYLLTTFEIQKYFRSEPRFKDVYSRNIIPKIKDGTYIQMSTNQ